MAVWSRFYWVTFLLLVVFESRQQVQREFLLGILAIRRCESRLADECAGCSADQVVGVFPQLVVRVLVIHNGLRLASGWLSDVLGLSARGRLSPLKLTCRSEIKRNPSLDRLSAGAIFCFRMVNDNGAFSSNDKKAKSR